jgi:hypothetical protein
MSTLNPLTPNAAGTVTATVASTTANIALSKTGISQQIMVQSLAANAVAFINFGDSTVTAAVASGTPILPGQIYLFTVGPTVTNVATIGTAANTLYFTSGQGSTAT